MNKLIKRIEKLSNAFGAPGFEEDVLEIIQSEIRSQIMSDSINNLFIGLDRVSGDRPVVALDCHSDEVGFMVENINSNGTISFLPLGGWFAANIPASPVLIKNSNGEYVKGVVASKPPHFMTPEELTKLPKLGELTIDVGTSSKEETQKIFGLDTGDPVVPDVAFSYDEKLEIMRGKAFDNRLGCVAVLETLERCEDKELKVDLVGNISSQEEVGLRGAQVAAYRVKPDFAIIFEGSPADDTFKDKNSSHGALKGGVQLRALDGGMISNARVLRFVKKIADEKKIPYQVIAREKGSTNGSKYHISENGIPVIVLGIPTRYVHTHYSYAALADLKAAIDLAYEIVKRLDEETIQRF